MTLTEALDQLTEGMPSDIRNWRNPIRPYVVSGISQTPYQAYKELKPEFKTLICNWIGHEPRRDEE